jgi:hypothetical protein
MKTLSSSPGIARLVGFAGAFVLAIGAMAQAHADGGTLQPRQLLPA